MVDSPVMSLRPSGADADRSDKAKLASKVANRIVDDIIAAGWPVGEVIGSEPQLLARYGVSRAVFREAVRLVEHQQVAWMRRGLGGGLVVTEPSVDAILDAVLLYLYRVDARLDEVFEARIVLEELAVSLAPGRLEEADVETLRTRLGEEASGSPQAFREMHRLFAEVTKNPALILFIEALNKVTLLYFMEAKDVPSQVVSEVHAAHERIVNAIIEGDTGGARFLMHRHLEAEADFLRRRRATRRLLDPIAATRGPVGSKRAEEVAREVYQGVVAGRLPPGQLIGSEADLVERYGVSRAVIRQAVRILEHHQIAGMRRGPGGGLIVLAPSANAVTDVVALYLERQGIKAPQLFELRAGIELSVVDLVISNMDESTKQVLAKSLEDEIAAPLEEYTVTVHDLHIVLGSLSGNRVLELLLAVLVRLSHMHESYALNPSQRVTMGTDVGRAHGAIVKALTASDRELARYRMQRHIDALGDFFD